MYIVWELQCNNLNLLKIKYDCDYCNAAALKINLEISIQMKIQMK